MRNRIHQLFLETTRNKRACFVAYVCAGDPDFTTSLEICRVLIEGGVDVLELGVPFSDPLADGPTNQLAAQRALESGMTADRVFDLVREIRKFSGVPIVFYTYYNLVFSKGVGKYAKEAASAGVDGLLTLDLPPEEAGDLLDACRANGLCNIFIVAPTTPEDRIRRIAKVASGFIYYVSREGVTGERAALADNIGPAVALIKKHTSLPVVVGFGISNREQVREIAAVADGAVVGSALVNCVSRHQGDPEAILSELRTKIRDLVAGVGPRVS